MMYPYRLHERVHQKYIEAYEWHELHQEGLGNRFMECVEKRLKQISEYPERYSKKHGNYREIKVEDFPYIIVYEFFKKSQTQIQEDKATNITYNISNEQITVIRIRRTKMNPAEY